MKLRTASEITETLKKDLSLQELITVVNHKTYKKDGTKIHEKAVIDRLKILETEFKQKLLSVQKTSELTGIIEEIDLAHSVTNQTLAASFADTAKKLTPFMDEASNYLNAHEQREGLLVKLQSDTLTEKELTEIKNNVPAMYKPITHKLFALATEEIESAPEAVKVYTPKIIKLDEQISSSISQQEKRIAELKLRAEQNGKIDQLSNVINGLNVVVNKQFSDAYSNAEQLRTTILLYTNEKALTAPQKIRFDDLCLDLKSLKDADKRWAQLDKVRTQLLVIEQEAEKLDKDSPARNDANTLYKAIDAAATRYIKGNATLSGFQMDSQNAIATAAKSNLKDIHGWKEILANVALAFASIPTLGLAYLVPALVKKSFFPIQVNKVIDHTDSLNNDIQSLK